MKWLNSAPEQADSWLYSQIWKLVTTTAARRKSETSAASSKHGELSHEAGFAKMPASVHLCAFSTFTMTHANSDTMHATEKSL